MLPRVHGLLPAPSVNYPSYPEYIPPHATLDYSSHVPTPVAATTGLGRIVALHHRSSNLYQAHEQIRDRSF